MTPETESPPESQAEAPAGEGLVSPPCSRHFVCPDGDYHQIRPLSSIWLDSRNRWWRKRWIVRLDYEDGEQFCWERPTEDEGKSVRDELIKIFSENKTMSITEKLPQYVIDHLTPGEPVGAFSDPLSLTFNDEEACDNVANYLTSMVDLSIEYKQLTKK